MGQSGAELWGSALYIKQSNFPKAFSSKAPWRETQNEPHEHVEGKFLEEELQ